MPDAIEVVLTNIDVILSADPGVTQDVQNIAAPSQDVVFEGPPGPSGASGGLTLTFYLTDVTSQTFQHPFSYPPNVRVIENGNIGLVAANYPDANTVYLQFSSPFTGMVILS